MKTQLMTIAVVAALALGAATTAVVLTSATPASAQSDRKAVVNEPTDKPIVEGPINYAAYESENGKIGGFTRVNDPQAVPGGNGSWNERRYGKLYRDFLIVTKPAEKNWGVLIIPASKLKAVHFGQE